MIFFRMLSVGCLLALSVCASCGVLADDAVKFPAGSIKLISDPENPRFSCGIELKSGDYSLDTSQPNKCNNDRLNYFLLESAPSATFIEFFSERNSSNSSKCPSDSQETRYWKYKIKTYIHPVTTVWISLADLRSANVGEILKAGVILVSKDYENGDHIDELSCIRVTRSALP